MPDAIELVKTIKKAAVEAVEATKPVNVCFGEVLSANPLTIDVDQKMTLGAAQLILSRNVTDYMTEVTVQWDTLSAKITHKHPVNITDSNGDRVNGNTENQSVAHSHDIEGRKGILIHNGLVAGDKVILIREQGGQRFIVWDRVGGGAV